MWWVVLVWRKENGKHRRDACHYVRLVESTAKLCQEFLSPWCSYFRTYSPFGEFQENSFLPCISPGSRHSTHIVCEACLTICFRTIRDWDHDVGRVVCRVARTFFEVEVLLFTFAVYTNGIVRGSCKVREREQCCWRHYFMYLLWDVNSVRVVFY